MFKRKVGRSFLVLEVLLVSCLCVVPLTVAASRNAANGPSFSNFESSVVSPIRISPAGTRMFVANTPNNSVSVFEIAGGVTPVLIKEIPVGIEPVSVNPVSEDQVWVISAVSDSASVVSVSKGIVTATIHVPDEPMDVVFSSGNAFISCSRSNVIAVVSLQTHDVIARLPVFGGSPRAMAVSPNGQVVYALFAIAGNATTIIPAPLAPPPPAPINPALPAPPQVGLIVSSTDPAWIEKIPYTIPANGIARIATGNPPSVSGYYNNLGTVNLGLGVNPVSGDLYVGNTTALNTVMFESSLQGHFVTNRLTRVEVNLGTVTAFDLNPNLNYSLLPNPAALSTSLAQPTGILVDPSGTFMYVANFGTDRVAWVDTDGNVQSFVETSGVAGSGPNADPANKKGPRALALNPSTWQLYVLNRISNTISIVDTQQRSLVGEIPVGTDPTPAAVKSGRGFLYDAKLSGNGTGSCASCHVDGEMDHLAWNLGDPNGSIHVVVQNGESIAFHPMKGPQITQSLRGLNGQAPYHWRGDQANLPAFNSLFQTLLGGSQLSDADMATYTNFLNTILYEANPNENLDRSLPDLFNGGNPKQGLTDFTTLVLSRVATGKKTCSTCHLVGPGFQSGSNLLIDALDFSPQPLKNPQLRNVYQRQLFSRGAGNTIDGFGLNHDGSAGDLTNFLNSTPFELYSQQQKLDMKAYLLCFDTGTAPAVGYSDTLTEENVNTSAIQSDWSTLEAQAAAANIDLIGRGTIQGAVHSILFQPAFQNYLTDSNGLTVTRSQLTGLISAGDTMSLMGVVPGTGTN